MSKSTIDGRFQVSDQELKRDFMDQEVIRVGMFNLCLRRVELAKNRSRNKVLKEEIEQFQAWLGAVPRGEIAKITGLSKEEVKRIVKKHA